MGLLSTGIWVDPSIEGDVSITGARERKYFLVMEAIISGLVRANEAHPMMRSRHTAIYVLSVASRPSPFLAQIKKVCSTSNFSVIASMWGGEIGDTMTSGS